MPMHFRDLVRGVQYSEGGKRGANKLIIQSDITVL